MVIGSLIAVRLAGCPEALRMSRPHAPHPVPSLSLECVEPLRARCPHAPWCLPNFDSAKVIHFKAESKFNRQKLHFLGGIFCPFFQKNHPDGLCNERQGNDRIWYFGTWYFSTLSHFEKSQIRNNTYI